MNNEYCIYFLSQAMGPIQKDEILNFYITFNALLLFIGCGRNLD